MRCPRCHSPHVRRSKRSAFEHLLALIRVFPLSLWILWGSIFQVQRSPCLTSVLLLSPHAESQQAHKARAEDRGQG
jgi:hypothetical protein